MYRLWRYVVRVAFWRLARIAAALMVGCLVHMCAVGDARADVNCFNSAVQSGSTCGDAGEARAAVYGMLSRWKDANPSPDTTLSRIVCITVGTGVGNEYISGYVTTGQRAPTCNGSYSYQRSRNYPAGKTCAGRNSAALADAKPWPTAPATCIAGCKVQGESFSQSSGGVTTYGMRNRTYNGDTCDPQPIDANAPINQDESDTQQADVFKPKEPECTALGSGQTGCVKSNGDYCATASTGKTFCWTPTQTGEQADGSEAQRKSKKGDPVQPPSLVVEDKDWQRTTGHQATTCLGTACTTYNVTNFTSVPKGTAKNGSGDNSSDGSGNTSGNGSASDGKKDDESQDSATDSGNCDTPPVCVGDTLKCLHLKYTWKIECNTKGNEISQGNGCGENDIPVCAGKSCKAEAYAQVIQQWKQRCAMEALGQGNAERAAGISNGDDAGVVEGIWGGESGGSGMTLRQDLVNVGGGGGSLLPDVEIEGQHWNVPQGFYDAIAAVRMVIIAMCTVIAMFVVGRNI